MWSIGCWWEPVALVRKDVRAAGFQRRHFPLAVDLVLEFEGLGIGTIPSLHVQLGLGVVKRLGWLVSLCLMPMRLVGETLMV